MAWTAPRTWVTGEVVTGALLNTHVRDNLLAVVPVGTVLPYAGSAAPNSLYLLCDGSAVSRTTYAALFALIGTTYGVGDGSTTFNLPDLRGRVPVGKGSNANVDVLGESEGLSESSRSPQHRHVAHLASVSGFPGNLINAARKDTGEDGTPAAIGNSGPMETPAYLVLNFIIKALQ